MESNPITELDYRANSRAVHMPLRGQLRLCSPALNVGGTDKASNMPGNLGSPVALSKSLFFGVSNRTRRANQMARPSTFGTPPFCVHVGHVVGLSAKEQMKGVHAKRSIAPMANFHSFRNCSVAQYPRCAVRENGLAATSVKHSISVLFGLAGPKPTAFRFCNPRPKSRAKGKIESLRKSRVLSDIFVGHNQVSFGCASAPRHVTNGAGALFVYTLKSPAFNLKKEAYGAL